MNLRTYNKEYVIVITYSVIIKVKQCNYLNTDQLNKCMNDKKYIYNTSNSSQMEK